LQPLLFRVVYQDASLIVAKDVIEV
jgi:hypothetical protein